MFDIPVAKRVRRADLYLSPSSRSPEPSEPDLEFTTLLHSKLENVYGPIHLTDYASSAQREGEAVDVRVEPGEPKEEGFEFRLFASPPVSRPHGSVEAGTDPATRIILDDDNDVGDPRQRGGFTVPERNPGYYFSDAAVPGSRLQERKREFEIAAVSGEDVRRLLGVRYSGLEVGWRVKHLRLRNGELVAAEVDEGASKPLVGGLHPDWQGEEILKRHVGGGKRGKPGKKRRIVLRTRKRRVEEAAERRREGKERKLLGDKEREEVEREKRTRRNREKKVKKKLKEKEMKAQSHGGGLDNAIRSEKTEEK